MKNLSSFGGQFIPGTFNLTVDFPKMSCDGDNLDYIPFYKVLKDNKWKSWWVLEIMIPGQACCINMIQNYDYCKK